jgi:ubiquinone/menaquinone biosynthesis C-methylase UbiE
MAMVKPEPNFNYRFMALGYKFRDFLWPRMHVVKEAGIRPGFHVLDYGCGPGSYITPLADLVGKLGKIYALDIHPLAIQIVQGIAAREGLGNIETIHSDCATGLDNNVIDVVLLYDIYHDLSDSDAVLRELHRVLKPEGLLSFSDHHMKEDEILSGITETGLFRLSEKGKKTYSFLRA